MDAEYNLVDFGLSEAHATEANASSLVPARVVVEHQDRYTVMTKDGPKDVFLEGKARKFLDGQKSRPVVGDWVGLNESEKINVILERTNAFRRKKAGQSYKEQVLASNVTTVYIVTSCNKEFSTHRLERFLLSAYDVTSDVHLVLNKIDLTDNHQEYIQEAQKLILPGTQIHPISVAKAIGLESLWQTFSRLTTAVLIGSSGVGKSSIGNLLLQDDYFPTGPIREKDDKGRHTTTRRELIKLPNDKGLLIDTPGLRDLSFWIDEKSLKRAYSDIYELARGCKFRNCKHQTEHECAVLSSYKRDERLSSFLRLKAELSSFRDN